MQSGAANVCLRVRCLYTYAPMSSRHVQTLPPCLRDGSSMEDGSTQEGRDAKCESRGATDVPHAGIGRRGQGGYEPRHVLH